MNKREFPGMAGQLTREGGGVEGAWTVFTLLYR